jgi:hypothetical protein
MRAYVPNEQGWICSLLHKVRVAVIVVRLSCSCGVQRQRQINNTRDTRQILRQKAKDKEHCLMLLFVIPTFRHLNPTSLGH